MTWWILFSLWKTSNTDNRHRYLTRIPRVPGDAADAANDGRRSRSLIPPNEGDMREEGSKRRGDWGDVVTGMGKGLLASSVVICGCFSSCSSSSERASSTPPPVPSSILSCVRCPTRANAALYPAASPSSLPIGLCTLHLEYLSLRRTSSSSSSSSSEESIPFARSCNKDGPIPI